MVDVWQGAVGQKMGIDILLNLSLKPDPLPNPLPPTPTLEH